MAFLRRRKDGRVEIRESVATPAGPRARTLAVFSGPLGPDLLERAEARARRPFDREALLAGARRLGIPVSERRADAAARALLAELRAGSRPDPRIVALLREALARVPAQAPPEGLAEVAAWVGVGPERRGEALRGLLRASDRIVRGRPERRERPREPFPRFRSRAASGTAAPQAAEQAATPAAERRSG